MFSTLNHVLINVGFCVCRLFLIWYACCLAFHKREYGRNKKVGPVKSWISYRRIVLIRKVILLCRNKGIDSIFITKTVTNHNWICFSSSSSSISIHIRLTIFFFSQSREVDFKMLDWWTILVSWILKINQIIQKKSDFCKVAKRFHSNITSTKNCEEKKSRLTI